MENTTRVAAVGGIVWLALVAWSATSPSSALWLIEPIFLLAPLVVVPLALGRIDGAGVALAERLLRFARAAHPLAAATVVVAFLLPRGTPAAAATGPWLAFSGVLALVGLARLLDRGRSRAAELALTAALLFVPVGAAALMLSRLGATPLGFEEPMVLLTAVHFHFAGFGALTITGLTGRILDARRRFQRWAYRVSVAGTIAGMPMLAAGITFSPALELAGALTFLTGLAVEAVLLFAVVRPLLSRRPVRLLCSVSATSALVALALAFAYAVGQFTGRATVALSTVARIHGPLNALGFVLLGLLSVRDATPRRRT